MWQPPTSKVVQAKQASEVQVDVSELNTKYQPTRPLWTERSDSNVKRKSSFRIGSLRTNVISLYPYTCLPPSICPFPSSLVVISGYVYMICFSSRRMPERRQASILRQSMLLLVSCNQKISGKA